MDGRLALINKICYLYKNRTTLKLWRTVSTVMDLRSGCLLLHNRGKQYGLEKSPMRSGCVSARCKADLMISSVSEWHLTNGRRIVTLIALLTLQSNAAAGEISLSEVSFVLCRFVSTGSASDALSLWDSSLLIELRRRTRNVAPWQPDASLSAVATGALGDRSNPCLTLAGRPSSFGSAFSSFASRTGEKKRPLRCRGIGMENWPVEQGDRRSGRNSASWRDSTLLKTSSTCCWVAQFSD